MKRFLLSFLTWWNRETLNTAYFTWRRGVKVGEDDEGNVYYHSRDGRQRWVIFNGEMEASRVPPGWSGWLHHTFEEPPTEAPPIEREWFRPHLENLSGTPMSYAPPGSIRRGIPVERRDYEAWSPE